MANNPEAKITVKMFNDDFKKGANELKKESQQISREFKLQSEQMKLTATETEKLNAKMEFLTKKHDVAKQSVKEHEQAYEQAKTMFGENSKAAEDMAKKLDNAKIEEAKLANEVELTNRALQGQQTEADKTASKFDEMGEKVKGVGDKMKNVGDGMTDAGARMTAGITAPIAGIAVAAKSAWEEVDDGLDTIVSKTGASGEALASLENSFKNVASTTKFDMQQVGDAIGEVNTQFGVTGEALDHASIKMLKFADINGADVAGSAIKSKQAMDAFGLSAEDLDMALDSVTLTAQNTGQSTDKLFEVITKNAPQLKAMGLDFAQATEVMGQFEKAGVDSSTAMSYMSRAQVTFAKDGLTMQEGLDKTIDAIKNASSETDALTIAAEVFGTKGATRMVDAIQRGTFNFEEFANAATDSAGAVENTFEGMEDPIDKVAIAMNVLKLAGADLFSQLQEILLPIGLQLIEMLQNALEWFSGLSDGMKKTIIVVLGIVAAIGPLITWLGLIISSMGSIVGVVGAVIPVLAKLGPMFNIVRTALLALSGPIGIIIAIVGVLAVVIYKNWDAIKEYTINAFNYVIEFLKKWGGTILTIITGPIGLVVSLVVKNWELIKSTTLKVFDSIVEFFKKWGPNILAILTGPIGALVLFISRNWETIKSTTSSVFNAVKNTAKSIWDGIKSTISSVVSGIVTWVQTSFNNMKSQITTVFNGIKTVATTIFNAVKSAITKPIETAKTTVLGIIDTIKSAFSKMKITIPKPKLPKIDISMGTKKVAGVSIPYPKFDISWFKTGGVFTRPVVAGNAGFGDVAEAIVPFEGSHAKRIAGLIAEQQTRLKDVSAAIVPPQPIYIRVVSELDGQEVANNQYKYIDGMTTDDYNLRGAVRGI